jgi:O-antigen/teichoic acid export membrane protein
MNSTQHTYKKYAKNVGLVTIANIISTLKGFILLPILTKALGAELYGTWTLISVTISLLAPLCTLELGVAIVRFLGAEKDKGKISKGFSSIFIVTSLIALAVSALIFVFSKPLAIAIFGGIDAAFYIQISASLIFLAAIDRIMLDYFRAFQQMERYASILILQTIGELILTAYLVLSGFGLFGVIIALLIVRIVASVIGFLWIASQIKISPPSFSVIKPYLPFALPILPTALCYWLINLGDRYVIGYFMGADAVGVYSASYGLGSLIAFFYAPIPIALFPAITNLYENNKIQELKQHLKYSLKFFLMFAIPAFFGLLILSKSLLTTLTTSEFVGGYMIVAIIALATILFNCGNINVNVLYLLKKTRTIGLLYGTLALINMVLNIILVPFIGIIGAAIATLITFMAQVFVVSTISFKRISYDIDFKFIMKSITASIIMAFVVWNLNPYGAVNILIAVGIATGVYVGVLVLLRGFTRQEYEFLKSMLKV